ncbi:hypothetical protein [Hymenobacter sp. PAMC 26628]|uniref:hypothetical protein n=1 Tax=Hymenobacter sp. PAMC 26628 TaxID=1484118 RepID=UPI00076FE588|nr:hypothetical protein [Hymenobacter sp. PAMC 26628]AMJ65512.1 hypothetical protein AXW84_08770 [Hymenobacter sp. PAMC 26628]
MKNFLLAGALVLGLSAAARAQTAPPPAATPPPVTTTPAASGAPLSPDASSPGLASDDRVRLGQQKDKSDQLPKRKSRRAKEKDLPKPSN